jgi:hypothetical protein
MARAYSISELLSMRKRCFPFEGEWREAFGSPEMVGVWFIWGPSGNGKSSFIMQLCKELCRFGRLAYDSLEEGTADTIVQSVKRHEMQVVNKKMLILDCESIPELSVRLQKKKSPDFVIIDSFQYCQLSYKQYIEFKQLFKNKLLIFISHADGKQPAGRAARSVMYDACLKIWIEGFRAISKGRYIGANGGNYTIWEEGATRHWGETIKNYGNEN